MSNIKIIACESCSGGARRHKRRPWTRCGSQALRRLYPASLVRRERSRATPSAVVSLLAAAPTDATRLWRATKQNGGHRPPQAQCIFDAKGLSTLGKRCHESAPKRTRGTSNTFLCHVRHTAADCGSSTAPIAAEAELPDASSWPSLAGVFFEASGSF